MKIILYINTGRYFEYKTHYTGNEAIPCLYDASISCIGSHDDLMI